MSSSTRVMSLLTSRARTSPNRSYFRFGSTHSQSHHHHHQTTESFDTPFFRGVAVAAVLGVVMVQVDSWLTRPDENGVPQKHPFTKWIEYNLFTKDEEWDKANEYHVKKAEDFAEFLVSYRAYERPKTIPTYYPEMFERRSYNKQVSGNQVNLDEVYKKYSRKENS